MRCPRLPPFAPFPPAAPRLGPLAPSARLTVAIVLLFRCCPLARSHSGRGRSAPFRPLRVAARFALCAGTLLYKAGCQLPSPHAGDAGFFLRCPCPLSCLTALSNYYTISTGISNIFSIIKSSAPIISVMIISSGVFIFGNSFMNKVLYPSTCPRVDNPTLFFTSIITG